MADTPEAWFDHAASDLNDCEFALGGGRYPLASFLAQQAAEKALKALFLMVHGRLWPVHDLVALAREVDAPESIIEACQTLNPHYTATRYPGRRDEYTEEVARLALDHAATVLGWVEEQA